MKKNCANFVLTGVLNCTLGISVMAGSIVEIENNNNIANANLLSFLDTAQGVIDLNDKDFYKLELPSPGTLNIDLLAEEKIDPVFEIFKSNGKLLGSVVKSNKKVLNLNMDLKKGIYYVALSSKDGDKITNYELYPSFLAFPEDVNEPNQKIAFATPTSLNDTIVGYMNLKSDIDFYEINLGSGGVLKVEVLNSFLNGEKLIVYNELGKELFKTKPSGQGNVFSLEYAVLTSGVYYVSFDSKDKDVQSEPYKITFSLDSINDSNEPNQKISEATQTVLNDTVEGYMNVKGDVDYYELNF